MRVTELYSAKTSHAFTHDWLDQQFGNLVSVKSHVDSEYKKTQFLRCGSAVQFSLPQFESQSVYQCIISVRLRQQEHHQKRDRYLQDSDIISQTTNEPPPSAISTTSTFGHLTSSPSSLFAGLQPTISQSASTYLPTTINLI